MRLATIKQKNIHIVGVSGTEGSAIFFLLDKLGIKDLTLHDFVTKKEFRESFNRFHEKISVQQKKKLAEKLVRSNIKYRNNYLKGIETADIVFLPTSYFRWKENKKLVNLVKNNKKIIYKTWYNLVLENFKGKIVGITGTAGKGTVVNLIYSILKLAKIEVFLMGDSWVHVNLDKILRAEKNSLLVIEDNNRYLKSAKWSQKSPEISVITNITNNHLDDHDSSFAKYQQAKAEIFNYQKRNDYLIYNKDDEVTQRIIKKAKSSKKSYSIEKGADYYQKGEFLYCQKKKIINVNELKIFGPHMISNALAAVAVADILKIPKLVIQKGLKQFSARHMRMEQICTVRGIKIINDNASTRPEATINAIKSFDIGKVNLILGGIRHKPNITQMKRVVDTINENKVKSVALIGKLSNIYIKLLNQAKSQAPNSRLQILKCKRLNEAVKFALKKCVKGDVLLFSPGAESFDMFKNYSERSEQFEKIIKKLK